MQIDETLLSKLENLSQLEIKKEYKEKAKDEFNQILAFVSSLNEIEEELKSIKKDDQKTPFREDLVKKSEVIKDIFSTAPQSADGFFIVPKIIE